MKIKILIFGLMWVSVLRSGAEMAVDLGTTRANCPADPSVQLHYFTRYETPQVFSLGINPLTDVVTPSLDRQSGLYRYDPDQSQILPFIQDENFSGAFFAWSPDGSQIAAVVRKVGKMGIWDAETGERRITFDEQNPEPTRNPTLPANELGGAPLWPYFYFDAAWSPDSKFLAAVGTEPLRVWNVERQELVFAPGIEGTRGSTNYQQQISDYLAWSPDSKYLALTEHSVIHVWDSAAWQETHTLTTSFDAMTMIAWSGEGMLAASGRGNPSRLMLWDTQSWEALDTFDNTFPPLRPRVYSIYSIAWSPDNCWLAVGASGSRVFILNPTDGSIVQTLGGDQLEGLTDVQIRYLSADKLVWSLDGSQIFAVIDGTISE